MRHGQWKQDIKEVTHDLLGAASDFCLLSLFLVFESMGPGHSGRDIARTFNRAYRDLEFFKSDVHTETTRHLSVRGWVTRLGKDLRACRITAAGRKRIAELFPTYKAKRPWDGKIYLITYDIPEKAHGRRDLLRKKLRALGCGMIQASVWMTPYYPRKILRELVQKDDIPGSLLVSDLERGGMIGDQTLPELIREIYQLNTLEQEYTIFIERCKKGFYADPIRLYCAFSTILQNDPQLPFDLLPKQWIGTRAYQEYQSTLRSLTRAKK